MKPRIDNSESDLRLPVIFCMRRYTLIAFLCLYFQGHTQVVSDSFKSSVDSLINAAPEGYSKIHIADGDLEFEVASLNYLGVVYSRTSSIRTAMDYNLKALELAESVENPSNSIKRSINVSVNCIGNLYQMLDQYDRAIEYFETSLGLETELNNQLGQAINHQNIGECKEELGDLSGALADYRTSLVLNEKIDNDMGRVICNNAIAKIYIKQDNPEKAVELLEFALPKAEKLGDGFLISPVFINLGWAKYLLKDYREAEKYMLKGLQVAKEKKLLFEESQANHLLANLNKNQQNFEKALTYNLRAEELEEQTKEKHHPPYQRHCFGITCGHFLYSLPTIPIEKREEAAYP